MTAVGWFGLQLIRGVIRAEGEEALTRIARLRAAFGVTWVLIGCAHASTAIRPSETEAVVHLRIVVSSEAAYSANNGWYFDSLECLLDAPKCLLTYPVSGPPFLTAEFAQPPPGYRARFHPGPAPPTGTLGPAMSKSSVTSYAYTLAPSVPGARWFCADNRPTLCVSEQALASPLPGRCPKNCQSILPWHGRYHRMCGRITNGCS